MHAFLCDFQSVRDAVKYETRPWGYCLVKHNYGKLNCSYLFRLMKNTVSYDSNFIILALSPTDGAGCLKLFALSYWNPGS